MMFMNAQRFMHSSLQKKKSRSTSSNRHESRNNIKSTNKVNNNESDNPMDSIMFASTRFLNNKSSNDKDSDYKKTKSSTDLQEFEQNGKSNRKSEKNHSFLGEKSWQKSKFFQMNESLKLHPFRNLIFSPEIPQEKFKNHLCLTCRGLIYAKNCLKQPSTNYINNKSINLKEKKRSLFCFPIIYYHYNVFRKY